MPTYPVLSFSTTTFDKEDVRRASVTEEFNPLSITIPISILEVELFTEDATFSIIDPSGDFSLLQHRTPLTLYENIDGTNYFIGRYFVDRWDNISDNLISLRCMDEMGLLDTITCRGGMWSTPTTVGSIISAWMTEVSISYDIDPDLSDELVKGWIPVCSYREAIQQLMFAAGGYVLCARQNGTIKFGVIDASGAITKGIVCGVPRTGQTRVWKKRWRISQWSGVMPTYTVTDSEQTLPRVNLRTQVTGVEVSMHDIVLGESVRQLFNGTLTGGEYYEIRFSQPMHSLTISGASFSSYGANYAIIYVETTGTVVLDGKVYIDTVSKAGVYMSNPDGVKENVLTIPDGSMINSSNGPEIAQRVYDYYQTRHVQESKLIRPMVYIGNEVIIDTLYGRQINGIIEKMELDLSGGFSGYTTVVGNPVAI